MGKRGPKPTPAITLARRGSPRADRREGEPTPARLTIAPSCPEWVQGKARELWESKAPGSEEARRDRDLVLPASPPPVSDARPQRSANRAVGGETTMLPAEPEHERPPRFLQGWFSSDLVA